MSPKAIAYISDCAAEWGTNKTAALHRIIEEHQQLHHDYFTNLSTALLNQIQEHYGNLFTTLRLKTRFADENIQVLLETMNSLLFALNVEGVVPTSVAEHPAIQLSKVAVKEKIAKNKQYNDSKKKKQITIKGGE